MTSRIRRSRLGAISLIASFVVLLVPGSAQAHAELVRAIPADGETVAAPVTVVTGRYTQDLAANSRLVVRDASGAAVATGSVDPADARRMIARPDTPLGAGSYEVQSTSVSADDGDIERVQWTFTVTEAASASPTEAPSATSSASASTAATPSSAPSETPSAPTNAAPSASPAPGDQTSSSGDVLLPIIAALAIVAIGGVFLVNRNRGRSA
jgi:methionine-rich copper-binding protein CopC